MYRKVLVPLDGSKLAECALGHVRMMVKEGSVGEVILLNVVSADDPFPELSRYGKNFDFREMRKALVDSARKYLADVQARLVAEGVQVKTEVIKASGPSSAIMDYARKNGMEMIVIATHGYTGMKKLMLGSVAMGVLHDSHVPVLLIRPEACLV